jgi:hypothetical protein
MTTSCGIESGSSGPSNHGHETAVGDSNNSFSAATTTRSTSRTTKISKGKRKLTSSSYYPGDSSSSLHEHSGSCLASSDMTAGRNHTTVCHDTPVIDIDDLYSPGVRPHLRGNHHGTSIGPNISAQLEADEMLARQLQEQLYNETPRVAPREDVIPDHLFPPPCLHVCARARLVHSLDVVKALVFLQHCNFLFS